MAATSRAHTSSTPTGVSPAAQVVPAPKFRIIDAVMILLALVSVTLVVLDIFFRGKLYEWGIFKAVVLTDLAITLIFVADFFVETRGMSFGTRLREEWFDILGLVPLLFFVWLEAQLTGVPFGAAWTGETRLLGGGAAAGGLVRLFRLVRIVRIVQAFARFLRATNMTFGEQVTKRFFDKYRRIVVAELTTPIMVAGITVSQEIIIRMKFLEAAGNSLDSKRAEIHAAVMEALQKNKVPDNLIAQPMIDKIIRDIENAVVNTVVDTLTGPELNKLVQEMIVETLDQFKQQLTSPEGKAMLKAMGAAPPAGAKTAATAPGDERAVQGSRPL